MPDINIGSKLDSKGFNQAETALNRLNNNAKSLAKTFGLTFGAAAVLSYAKTSIKAAAADQKAQQQLALALRNVGLGRDVASSEAYVQKLQNEFGIIDDKLRPAYQTLAVATRDSSESQRLMGIALDVAAANSLDLEFVTKALGKAYLGNNTSLTKLGIGLSKADLKTKSFKEITDQLSTTFAGAAKSASQSYQGSIDKLSVAASNAVEVIGTGLIEAISKVGSTDGVDGLTSQMEKLSFYVSDTIEGMGILIASLKSIPLLGKVFDFLLTPALPTMLGTKARLTRTEKFPQGMDNAHLASLTKEASINKKILNTTVKLTAEQLKQLAAARLKNAIDKANLPLGKGTDVFDIEKIQLQAAEINQAQLLGQVTNQAQLLQITNDLARLQTKKDILALEAAIASGDVKAIEAATAKLNGDLKILGALTNQELKLKDIKSILDEIAPKDLINIENLNKAIDLLGKISLPSLIPSAITALSPAEVDAILANEPSSVATTLTPAQISGQRYAAQAKAQMDAYLAKVAAGLGGMAGSSFAQGTAAGLPVSQALSGARYSAQAAAAAGISVTVYAGTIANPEELTTLIQNSLISLNRRGDLLTYAGSL